MERRAGFSDRAIVVLSVGGPAAGPLLLIGSSTSSAA